MKKKIILKVLIFLTTVVTFIFLTINIVRETNKNKFNSTILLTDYINNHYEEIELYSRRYDAFNDMSLSRFFLIEGIEVEVVDSQVLNDIRFNIIDTEKKAKMFAKMVLPIYFKNAVGKHYFCNAYEYKNLWIVGIYKTPVNPTLKHGYYQLDKSYVFIIISRHTAEVLKII